MPEKKTEIDIDEVNERVKKAYIKAYGDVPAHEVEHMAKNFIQIINGIMDIGEKIEVDHEINQMDIANSMVYWCVTNSRLEDLVRRKEGPGRAEEPGPVLKQEEFNEILSEFAGRAADWLIGLEVLKSEPEAFERFIKGAISFGADNWERNRGKLAH